MFSSLLLSLVRWCRDVSCALVTHLFFFWVHVCGAGGGGHGGGPGGGRGGRGGRDGGRGGGGRGRGTLLLPLLVLYTPSGISSTRFC